VQVWLAEEGASQALIRGEHIVADTELEALALAHGHARAGSDGSEMLSDGQEEVFSRTKVTSGAVGHGSTAGDAKA
jgi:hypothetical protein